MFRFADTKVNNGSCAAAANRAEAASSCAAANALLGFSGRVSDHSGSSAHEGNRLVSAFLEMLEYHNADHVSDVERVSRGVNAYVCRCRAFHKFLLGARHDVLDHASPSEFLDKILVHICFFLFQNRWPGGRCHPRTANIDIFFRNITGEQ